MYGYHAVAQLSRRPGDSAALPRGRGAYLDALPPAWPSSVMSQIPGVLME